MRIISYFPAVIRATFRLLDTKRRGPHAHQTHRPPAAIRPHPRIQPLQSPGPTLPHIQRRQTQTTIETRPAQTRSREPEHRRDDEHGREPAARQNKRLAQHGSAHAIPRPPSSPPETLTYAMKTTRFPSHCVTARRIAQPLRPHSGSKQEAKTQPYQPNKPIHQVSHPRDSDASPTASPCQPFHIDYKRLQ